PHTALGGDGGGVVEPQRADGSFSGAHRWKLYSFRACSRVEERLHRSADEHHHRGDSFRAPAFVDHGCHRLLDLDGVACHHRRSRQGAIHLHVPGETIGRGGHGSLQRAGCRTASAASRADRTAASTHPASRPHAVQSPATTRRRKPVSPGAILNRPEPGRDWTYRSDGSTLARRYWARRRSGPTLALSSHSSSHRNPPSATALGHRAATSLSRNRVTASRTDAEAVPGPTSGIAPQR